MKIGIIDDDSNFIDYFRKLMLPKLAKVLNEKDVELVCSNNLFDYDTLNSLDIVFIDIQLNDYNSIDIIYKSKIKIHPKIVIISSNRNLVFQSQKIKPIYFIRKSNLIYDFNFFLEVYKEELKRNKIIKLQYRSRFELVKIDTIYYIIVCGHDVTVVTENKEYTKIGTLKKLLLEINDCRFVQIQKGIYINLDFVDDIQNDQIFLKNGILFRVSRFYKKSFNERYIDYLLDANI